VGRLQGILLQSAPDNLIDEVIGACRLRHLYSTYSSSFIVMEVACREAEKSWISGLGWPNAEKP